MGYRPMTDAERADFLRSPVRPAILATVRADGRAHAAPIWYAVDGETLLFNTGAETVKGRNLARDGRATLCVQDDQPPFSFAMLEGRVELIDEPSQVHDWAGRIGARYMGADRTQEFADRNGVPGELLVRFHVERAVTARDVAD
jgi:PPOX class probable F420-dependent enzyme